MAPPPQQQPQPPQATAAANLGSTATTTHAGAGGGGGGGHGEGCFTVAAALEWCADHASRLRRIESPLEFALRKRAFLELVRQDRKGT